MGEKKARRPLWFHPEKGGLVTFAGLYGSWKNPATETRERTFTIITTAANDVVAKAHDRMPVIISPEDAAKWLEGDDDEAFALLKPAPVSALVATAVSKRVNSVANDDASILEPDAPEEEKGTLPLFK
jgi:putative SOS response-associated peptidase YedK